MQIKDEASSSNNSNGIRASEAERKVKQESAEADFNITWNERQDVFNQDEGRAGNPIDLSSKQKPQEKAQKPDDFKRLELACIWEKRLPKNEILLMNVAQNLKVLSRLVEDQAISFMQALKILIGLQKVHQRRMMYLYDDSKYVLNQLQSPFVPTEQVDSGTKNKGGAKRVKAETGAAGRQPAQTNMKLDLKNSKWWNTGFDNQYLQQQLTKYLETQNEQVFQMPAMVPVEVRGAEALNQSALLDNTHMALDLKSDIRYQEAGELEQRNAEFQIQDDVDNGFDVSPFMGELAPESAGVGEQQPDLVNVFNKLNSKDLSKHVFGEKTFDFADLQPELEIALGQQMPKDKARRKHLEKALLISDQNLDGKVNKLRTRVRNSAQKSVRFESMENEAHLLNRMNTLSIEDPLAEVFGFENANTKAFDNLGQMAINNSHIKQFLGIGTDFEINDETALFETPMEMDELMEEDALQQSPEANYGEDVHNGEIFRDAFSPMPGNDMGEFENDVNDFGISPIQAVNQPAHESRAEETLNKIRQNRPASDSNQNQKISLEKAAQEVHGNAEPTKADMISTFMDMLMLARNGGVKINQNIPSEKKMWNIDEINQDAESKKQSNIEMEF